MSVTLTIHLLREGTALPDAIDPNEVGDGQYVLVPSNEEEGLRVPHTCYRKQPEPKPALWTPFLTSAFDFGDDVPKNMNSGCIVFLEVKERIFGVAFGTGRHSIAEGRKVYDFGKRAAPNLMDPDRIRELQTDTLTVQTRERQTSVHAGARLSGFGADSNTEMLRSVDGFALAGLDFSQVRGGEALQVRGYSRDILSLPDLCELVLAAYEQERSALFDALEGMTPVKDKALKEKLDELLDELVDNDELDNMEFFLPAEVRQKTQKVCLSFGRKSETVDALVMASVRPALASLTAGATDDRYQPHKVKVTLLDDNGDDVERPRPLGHHLHAEVEHDGSRFVRVRRQWHEVSDDHMARINQSIAELDDLSDELDLPEWDQQSEAEESDFNLLVAMSKKWLFQDKKLVYLDGQAGVEPCDLLTPGLRFVHVKDGHSSAALDHLFGQVRAAADLQKKHLGFSATMKTRFETDLDECQWKAIPWPSETPTFVAAIGRKDPKKALLGTMLVAKINLLSCASDVRALGYGFALAGFKVIPKPKADKKPAKAAA